MSARASRTSGATNKKIDIAAIELRGRMKMALALAVSLNNDTLFSLLNEIDSMLRRGLPDFHNTAMLDWRRTITAELNTRGIFTA